MSTFLFEAMHHSVKLLYTHSNDAVSNFKLTIYFVKNDLEREKKNPKNEEKKKKRINNIFIFILSFCFKKHFSLINLSIKTGPKTNSFT